MSSDNGAPVQVVVIGAGPTGVTVATLLAQYGVRTLVLDRWDSVYPQPRAVHMDDEVLRILARIGVADEFAAISRPALGLRLLDRHHRVLNEFTRTADTSVHGFPQANMYDQPDLENLLRENTSRVGNVTLHGNVEVTDVVVDGRGRVRVTYTDRAGGDDHVVDADYVLGCDGANSLVRERLGITMKDLRFEQRWLVVDIATDARLDLWEGVHQVCDPYRAATYMRIGPKRYRWEFRLLDGEAADDFGSLDKLEPLIAPWTADLDCGDLELIRVAEYTFRAQIADRWRRGPVFLLGDAAHLTPPFIGQGVCAGLRDAMNLSWKLAGVISGDLPSDVLETYERERKRHARHMIELALTIGRAMTAGGRVGDILRRMVVPRLGLLPGLRDKIVDSATPALRRSSLIQAPRGRRTIVGRLCPNALVDSGTRLDAVLAGGFGFVVSVPLTGRQKALLADRGAVVVTAEPATELGRWLHRGRANAAIVRPDGTVMAAGRDIDRLTGLLPYFRSWRTAEAPVKSDFSAREHGPDGLGDVRAGGGGVGGVQ